MDAHFDKKMKRILKCMKIVDKYRTQLETNTVTSRTYKDFIKCYITYVDSTELNHPIQITEEGE